MEYKNLDDLLDFNPDRQKGWNFYTWEYQPGLIIDLSLSNFHRVIGPLSSDIVLTVTKPKIGYIYVFQIEKAYDKRLYLHNTDEVSFYSPNRYPWPCIYPYIPLPGPIDINYLFYLCYPKYTTPPPYILEYILGAVNLYPYP